MTLLNGGNGNGTRHLPSQIFIAVMISALSLLAGHAVGYERAVARVDVVAGDVNAVQLTLAAVQVEQAHMTGYRLEIIESVEKLQVEVAELNRQLAMVSGVSVLRARP